MSCLSKKIPQPTAPRYALKSVRGLGVLHEVYEVLIDLSKDIKNVTSSTYEDSLECGGDGLATLAHHTRPSGAVFDFD